MVRESEQPSSQGNPHQGWGPDTGGGGMGGMEGGLPARHGGWEVGWGEVCRPGEGYQRTLVLCSSCRGGNQVLQSTSQHRRSGPLNPSSRVLTPKRALCMPLPKSPACERNRMLARSQFQDSSPNHSSFLSQSSSPHCSTSAWPWGQGARASS